MQILTILQQIRQLEKLFQGLVNSFLMLKPYVCCYGQAGRQKSFYGTDSIHTLKYVHTHHRNNFKSDLFPQNHITEAVNLMIDTACMTSAIFPS